MKWVLVLFPFYGGGNWDLDRINEEPQKMECIRATARTIIAASLKTARGTVCTGTYYKSEGWHTAMRCGPWPRGPVHTKDGVVRAGVGHTDVREDSALG